MKNIFLIFVSVLLILSCSEDDKSLNNLMESEDFLNNNLSSSVNYSKSFPGSAGVRISLTANMSQNTQTKLVNLTLPTFTVSSNRFYPFERKGKSKGI